MTDFTFLKSFLIFSDLEESQLKDIYELLNEKSYQKGETIFLAGDKGESMFFLREGKVKITRNSPDGKEHIVKFIEPGEVFGEVILFGHEIYPATTICLEDSRLNLLKRDDFKDYFLENPEIGWGMLKTMADKLFFSQSRIESLALLDSKTRIIQSLLDMAGEDDLALKEMSQQQLANYLGLTRETVSRNISQLKDEGLIENQGRKVLILDREGLEAKLI
ncbi:MAG: Crp/Fnr family transcriptional regulator [Bacillota bacterium]